MVAYTSCELSLSVPSAARNQVAGVPQHSSCERGIQECPAGLAVCVCFSFGEHAGRAQTRPMQQTAHASSRSRASAGPGAEARRVTGSRARRKNVRGLPVPPAGLRLLRGGAAQAPGRRVPGLARAGLQPGAALSRPTSESEYLKRAANMKKRKTAEILQKQTSK